MPVVAAGGEELGQHELVERGRPGPGPAQLRPPPAPRGARAAPARPARPRAPAPCSPCRRRRRGRGPAPASRRAAVGRSGTRRRSRPRPARRRGRGPTARRRRGVSSAVPQRELVGGGEQHGVQVVAGQFGTRRPTGRPTRLNPTSARICRCSAQAVGLHARSPRPQAVEGVGQRPQALAEARAHDHPFRCGAHPPRAREVARERRAQLRQALGVGVAVCRRRRPAQRRPGRGEPLAVREGRDVREARPQVVGDGARLPQECHPPATQRQEGHPAATARPPGYPSPAARSATPPRRAGCRPPPPCCGRSRGRSPTPATAAATCPARAAPTAPPPATPAPAPPAVRCGRGRGAGPGRKWPKYLARDWTVDLVLSCLRWIT